MGVFTTGQLEATLVSEHQVNPGRAKRLVAAFIAKHGPIPSAYEGPGPEAWWYAWDREIEHPFSQKRHQRQQRKVDRQVARRQSLVDRLAARRRELDPGPVAPSRRAAADWARTSAISGPVWHATRAGPLIMQTGLRSRKVLLEAVQAAGQAKAWQNIETLGGGPEHVVSVSPDRKGAVRIAAFLAALNEVWLKPDEVARWFRLEWARWLEKNVHQIKGYSRRGSTELFDRFVGKLSGLDLAHGPGPLRLTLNSIAHYFGTEPGFPVAFHVPWIMRTPPEVPSDWIGVVEARACIDQLVLSSHPYTTRGKVVSGQAERYSSFGLDCPTERGGPRENDDPDARSRNTTIRRKRNFMGRAAAAWDTGNAFEVDEIRVCPTDLTVVTFEPMRDWRRILKPTTIRR